MFCLNMQVPRFLPFVDDNNNIVAGMNTISVCIETNEPCGRYWGCDGLVRIIGRFANRK